MKQVIAMGTDIDPENPLLDLYILAQSNKIEPKICLLPTASGDNNGYINMFYSIFKRYPCKVSHLSLFRPHTADMEDFLLNQDIIFVSGGQSKTMLGAWREWLIPDMLRKAYDNGTILSGGSAGSVCWFTECITDSIPGKLTVMPSLGILPYSNCPHFSSSERISSYIDNVNNKTISPGYVICD